MEIKEKLKFIAEWLKCSVNEKDAKEVLSSKKTIYDEKVYKINTKKDSFLFESSSGNNSAFYDILKEICGQEFLDNPENKIWYIRDDEELRIDTDLLVKFEKEKKKQYLADYDILTFYEEIYDNGYSCSHAFYILDFTHRKIIPFTYEQDHEGDDQWIEYDEDNIVSF